MNFSVSTDGGEWSSSLDQIQLLVLRMICRWKDNKLQRNFSGSLEFVAVAKTRHFEQPSSARSTYPRPRRDNADERPSAFKCRCKRYGHKRVSGVWSGQFSNLLGKWSVGSFNNAFGPGIYTPLWPTVIDDLEMGGSAENPILFEEEEDKESIPPTVLVTERPTQPPSLLRSRQFGTIMEKCPDYVDRKLFQ